MQDYATVAVCAAATCALSVKPSKRTILPFLMVKTCASGVSIGALFRVMLLTGQREGEVAGMRRAEIDAAKRQWVIPGARTKNGKEHVVHLGDVTMEVLPADDDRDLVFSATGKMPAVGFGFG